jgi:hypothetical protein
MDHGENCIMMNFTASILHRILLNVIKSRRMRWDGHVAHVGEGRRVYRVLIGRPEGKRPLGRPRHRWENNMKMDLREIGIDGANWIQLAQDQVQWQACVNTVMNFRFHQKAGCFLISLVTISFNILHHGVSK